MPEKFAETAWTAEDVQTLRPEWNTEKCEEWLQNNERYMQDRLVELGWEVMESLLNSSED